jgi:hypothetical protein
MKRIASKKDLEKKQKRNQFIIGGVLIFVMFGSVFGIIANSFGESEEIKKINYNGFEFVNQNGFWILELENFLFVFENNPKQIEFNESVNISPEINLANSYSGMPLYVFSENNNAKMEIYRNLDPRANNIVQRMQDACFEEECGEDLPIKTCEDNFIIIRENNNSRIIQEDNCVFIEGKKEDLVKLTDKYLFKMLGVE